MHKRIALTGLALLGTFAGATTMANTQPGFYAGASVGQATYEVDEIGLDDDDIAFKIFGGYNVNEYFAIEAGYFDAGKQELRVGGRGAGAVEAEIDGVNFSAIGRLPLGDVFSLFGKVGFAAYNIDARVRVGNTTASSASESDDKLSYGIGAAFSIGPSFELRAEYEAVDDLSDGDFTTLTVGGLFKF